MEHQSSVASRQRHTAHTQINSNNNTITNLIVEQTKIHGLSSRRNVKSEVDQDTAVIQRETWRVLSPREYIEYNSQYLTATDPCAVRAMKRKIEKQIYTHTYRLTNWAQICQIEHDRKNHSRVATVSRPDNCQLIVAWCFVASTRNRRLPDVRFVPSSLVSLPLSRADMIIFASRNAKVRERLLEEIPAGGGELNNWASSGFIKTLPARRPESCEMCACSHRWFIRVISRWQCARYAG